jgi:adenylate cyclase
VGVIAVESRAPAAFEAWHEAYLEIVSGQVAFAIENMIRRGRESEHAKEAAPEAARRVCPSGPPRRFRFFRNDECVFLGDEYLVRNVPAKILWRLLRAYDSTGRTSFSNRELRLDASLGLPALRDNLESRLVLLRKRLAEKCPEIALSPTARGHFRLDVACPIELEERDSA